MIPGFFRVTAVLFTQSSLAAPARNAAAVGRALNFNCGGARLRAGAPARCMGGELDVVRNRVDGEEVEQCRTGSREEIESGL